jgi:hypothetical protein
MHRHRPGVSAETHQARVEAERAWARNSFCAKFMVAIVGSVGLAIIDPHQEITPMSVSVDGGQYGRRCSGFRDRRILTRARRMANRWTGARAAHV